MNENLVVVDGFVPTASDTTNIREECWSFALDQRCFGPRKLLIAFGDADGTFRGLAYTDRRSKPEEGLGPCIRHVGLGSAAAIALCDEAVEDEPSPNIAPRFEEARSIAARFGIRLVDWIACDDDRFRSFRLCLEPNTEWWDL